MARPLWTGSLSFGLVTVPVSIVPALQNRRATLHLLHDADHARLQRRMICPAHNAVVHPEHIQKGYEYAPGKYVVVLQEEINSVEPRKSSTIEIRDFVDEQAVAPVFYDRPYYLVPAGAERPYALLVEALAKTRKVGIAEFVMRDRQYLSAVQSIDGVLCLMLLHYAESVADAVEFASQHAPEQLVAACREVIGRMKRKDFDPSRYDQDGPQRLMRLVEEKRSRKEVVHAPPVSSEEEEPGDIADLLAALEQSVEQAARQRKS